MSAVLTVTEAAKRVRRDRRTIERWIEAGLPVTIETRGKTRTRYIDETMLLAWYRQHTGNSRAMKHLKSKHLTRPDEGT